MDREDVENGTRYIIRLDIMSKNLLKMGEMIHNEFPIMILWVWVRAKDVTPTPYATQKMELFASGFFRLLPVGTPPPNWFIFLFPPSI